MSLEKSIEEFRVKRENLPCPLIRIYEQLNDTDKKAFDSAMKNNIPDSTLAYALRKEGFRIAEVSISQHRRGVCRCQTNN